MPFTNAYHGGSGERLDLGARIDVELRTRIEDAVDFACLDAMVRERDARGAPAPVADDPHDREEYGNRVSAFLDRLHIEIVSALSGEQRRHLGVSPAPARNRDVTAALAVQMALAKELPDYWQRFDAVRLGAASDGGNSRGQSRRLIDWLLGCG